MVTLVKSRRAIGESLHTWRNCWESVLPAGTDFSQNSRPYIVLKFTHNPHTLFVLHLSQPTATHSLFPVIILLILSMAGCICQEHLLGSLQINVQFGLV